MTMNSKDHGPCLVCGGPAIGINFAVATCAPCKAFFRRNAVKLGAVDFICRSDGDCSVAHESRRICNCCRLAKCFRVGMQKSLIRTPAEREARKELVQQNRQKRAELAHMQKSHFNRPLSISHLLQRQSKYLLSSDQALLTNIFGTHKKTHTLPDGGEYPSFPRVEHSLLHTIYNEYEERHKLFIDYIKSIPEFGQLSIDDKKHLLQNQYVETIILNNQITSKFISKTLLDSLTKIYDHISGSKQSQSMARFIAYMHDPVLLKIILIIQTLSNDFKRYRNGLPTDCIYDNPSAIFAGQNVYIELLWRYLLSRLPSERDTVKFFNKLVLDLLFLQETAFVMERYVTGFHDEINQMNPLMQNLWLV